MAAVSKTHVRMSAASGDTDDEMSADGGQSEEDVPGASDGEEAEDEDGGKEEENVDAGWAQAMAKILGKKTAENKNVILAKNRQLDKMKEEEKQQQLEKKKQVDRKRLWEMMNREKPDLVKDRNTERGLQRTATRGVVQLFNAVRKHQKNVGDQVKEASGSERKKAKIMSSVSKKDFIDVLRRTDGDRREAVKTEKDNEAAVEEKPAWTVLRDDYMMGATMKDWDKDSEGEDAHTAEGHKSD